MAAWPQDELVKIAAADDLHISPLRDDGVTYGTPTWIWSVALDDGLYVRAYNGRSSRWHQAAVRQRAGRITVGYFLAAATSLLVLGRLSNHLGHRPVAIAALAS